MYIQTLPKQWMMNDIDSAEKLPLEYYRNKSLILRIPICIYSSRPSCMSATIGLIAAIPSAFI